MYIYVSQSMQQLVQADSPVTYLKITYMYIVQYRFRLATDSRFKRNE